MGEHLEELGRMAEEEIQEENRAEIDRGLRIIKTIARDAQLTADEIVSSFCIGLEVKRVLIAGSEI